MHQFTSWSKSSSTRVPPIHPKVVVKSSTMVFRDEPEGALLVDDKMVAVRVLDLVNSLILVGHLIKLKRLNPQSIVAKFVIIFL
jgi:ABC-type phosphonate transport system ATPase subunit